VKTFILVVAALTVSTAAFAEPNGPTRRGDKCWVVMDQRGFGFWDRCATGQELTSRNRQEGLHLKTPQPRTISNVGPAGPGGGGGGGGGGE
jgi:hypothetical protein